MPWPLSQDYNEAIQNASTCFFDVELRRGEAVEFSFLDQGIRVRGSWYPVLKMQWVEGFALNTFVRDNVDKPRVLQTLCQIWLRLSQRLHEANLSHCDLQHGNVLLVPGSKAGAVGVKLVDYDGMCVPALELLKSIELGHAAYQHPQRLREGTYGLQIDRFPHLVIYTAIRALAVGGRALWEKYDSGDNLLFTQKDLAAPEQAAVFQELRRLNDPQVKKLVETLGQAAQKPVEQVPLLEELVETKAAVKSQAAPAAVKAAAPSAEAVFAAATGAAPAGRRTKHDAKKKSSAGVAIAAGVGAVVLIGGVTAFMLTRGSPTSKAEVVAELHKTQASRATNVDRLTSAVRPQTKVATRLETKIEPKTEPKTEPKEEPKPEPEKKAPDYGEAHLPKKCLQLRGRDYVELANTRGLLDLNRGSFTIEMWVRLRPGGQYLVGDESWPGVGEPVSRPSGFILRSGSGDGDNWDFNWTMAPAKQEWWYVAGTRRRVGSGWQHISVCKTPEEVRIYWDGKLYVAKSCKGEKFNPCPSNVFLGLRKNGFSDRRVDADFRAFRISGKALYDKEYPPPKNLEKTPDTLVLLDFGIAQGNRLPDLSDNKHDGAINGGQWVEVAAADSGKQP
jgi:hypothetical protein